MNRRIFLGAAGAMALGLGWPGAAQAAPKLPATPGSVLQGRTLEEALRSRQSRREYAPTPLPPEVLSGLLWAAWGVNRPDSGKRTAPSARNRQEISLYVATAQGVFLYDAPAHALVEKSAADARAATGQQAYAATAPVNLVYVADLARAAGDNDEDRLLMAAMDTGFISQNVYLFCAALNLATVVRASFDQAALGKALGLAPGQRPMLAQCVGYPKA